jgi:hypothetical protein
MDNISVEFDLNLPNEFLVDHSQTEGKTRKFTYHGPDKVYLQLGEDGTETHGPLTEEDIADGRPIPADVVEWYEVDCTTNPLICQLRGPVIDELQEERDGEEVVHPGSPAIDGYTQFTYQLPLMPDDIYDRYSVKLVDGELTLKTWSVPEKLLDRQENLTWDDIRKHRNQLLEGSDARVTTDMPTELQDQWKAYRQKLRDLPAVMEAAGVEPSVAFYMFPEQPLGATSIENR